MSTAEIDLIKAYVAANHDRWTIEDIKVLLERIEELEEEVDELEISLEIANNSI